MSAVYLLIGAGGAVALGFLAAFVWAVRTGQFDDTDTPAIRVLLDEAAPPRDAPAQDSSRTSSRGLHVERTR